MNTHRIVLLFAFTIGILAAHQDARAIAVVATPVPVVTEVPVPTNHEDFPTSTQQIRTLWDTDQKNSQLPEWASGDHVPTPLFQPKSQMQFCSRGGPLPKGSLNKETPKCELLPQQLSFINESTKIGVFATLAKFAALSSISLLQTENKAPLSQYTLAPQTYGQSPGSPETDWGACESYVFQSSWDSSLQSGQGWWSLYDNPELYLFDAGFMGNDMAPFRGIINGVKNWFTSAKAITDYWRTNPLGQSDYQRRGAATAECRAMQGYITLPAFSAPVGPGNSWVTVGGNTFDMEGYCWAMNYGGDNRGALGPDGGFGHPIRQLTHYAVMTILLNNYLQGSYIGWMNPTEQIPAWLKARYTSLGMSPSVINHNYITDKLEVFAVPNGFYVRQFLLPQSQDGCAGAGAASDSDPISLILDEDGFKKESSVEVAFSLEPQHPTYNSKWRGSKSAPLLVHLKAAFNPKDAPTKFTAEDLFGTWSFGGELSRDGKTKVAWGSGFEALKTFDADNSGTLTGKELELLALWSDENRNGKVESGEVNSLEGHNIVSLRVGPVVETSTGDLEVSDGFTIKLPDGSVKSGRALDWFGMSGSDTAQH